MVEEERNQTPETEEPVAETPQDLVAAGETGLDTGPAKGPALDQDEGQIQTDAERNRQAIICAAGSVFAEHGTAVTLEHIADVAGVGVGTIYRRFPTIDDLVAVVLEEKMRRYADRTEEAAMASVDAPWEAFRDWELFIME